MTIDHVVITNWVEGFWKDVASRPDEPLIKATIEITLSHSEYHALLDSDQRKKDDEIGREKAQEAVDKIYPPCSSPS